MNDHAHAAKQAKQHTIYKNAAGKRLPGVTTITGVMDKPALVAWANRIGLQGIMVREYVDEMATIGTLAHYIVECDCRGEKPDLSDYSPNQVSLAENSAIKYFEWLKGRKLEVIFSEKPLISEAAQVGGTVDVYGKINGVPTLIDLKTCKACYPEHFTQVAAYAMILRENGYAVDDVRIIRIGRDESEGFEDRKVPDVDLHIKRFLICRELYSINAKIAREG